ncbi:MAG TPA: alpha/beta fold hydrolase [Pyrinomonadaceae bacterium]|nr:alpha/beta fold hydrolase [Pyrinomonadaceae bacterium]
MSKMLIIGWLTLFDGGLTALSQSNDVFPIPETYKVEGIPEIKNSEVENLFYDPSSIRSNLIWDVDGKNRRMLVTDQTNNVYLVNSPLSEPVRLFDKIFPYSVKFNSTGDSFAFTSDHENEDNYQLYLYDLKDNSQKKLVSVTGKEESIDSFIWEKSGNSLFFTRVDYDSKISKLCNYDFQQEKCYQVDLKGIWNVLDSNNETLLLKYWKASSSQLLYTYDLKKNKLIPIDEKGNTRRAFLVKDTVFWTSEGNEFCKKEPCLLSLDLKSNKKNQLKLPADISNLQDIKISTEGNNLLLQETKDGIDKLHIFQIKKDRIAKEIPPFISDSYVIWHTRWLTDNEIVYTLENIGKPASIQSYNLKTQKFTNWTKERLPSQLENKVSSPEIFKWTSFDQKEIPGYKIRPVKYSGKTPVLIFVHGGPQVLDKPIFNAQEITLASSLGLTIIHTNIRGSSGFGKDFMDADDKEKRGNAVKDIQALLNWIEKQSDLDASQIYLRGQSYGGFIVLSTALQEPHRIKGVIAEYPLISIKGLLSQSWIDETATNEYGDPKNEILMNKLDSLSPLNNTNRWNNIPLFLTRGKRDERNPEQNVMDLKNQLQKKGSEVWFIYSTTSGHGFSGKYVTAAMYQFLKKQIN